ncbi:MAG: glycerophosphodiester phosphodiesterase [Bryobacteraceae bacterium]|nr:glycerophosphodiester phosphodiesterase [Bryobacteraceae bacterium]
MRTLVLIVGVLSQIMSIAAQPKILVHGHRGARAVMPENTLPAFQYAIRSGADVLELDMGVTKDNVVVVSHDSLLSAPVCTGPRDHAPIRELTLDEVRKYDCGAKQNPSFPSQKTVPFTRMPTLDEVFEAAKASKVDFNIETKILPDKPELTPTPEEFVTLVLAVIRKHQLEKRVILQSFDFRTLRAMKKIAPEIRLSALYAGEPKDFVAIAKEAGEVPIVSPMYPLVSKDQVDAAHKSGLQVVPWTANKPEDWQKLIDAGVDAIITDDPAALVSYLKRKP